MIELTEDQRRELNLPEPVAIDPQQSNQVCFLISAEQYRRARQVLETVEEIDPSFYEIESAELTDAQ